MKVGDLVRVSFPGSIGVAKIILDEGFGFYKILFDDELRMMHEDYLEILNDSQS